MKKRIFALAMVSTMGIMALVGCGPKYNEDYSVAMVTDYGDITDESFNQATYEAGKEWCKENMLNSPITALAMIQIVKVLNLSN